MLQPVFCQSLHIKRVRQVHKTRAEPIQDTVGGGEVLLFDIFQRAQIVRPEILRRRFQHRFEILIEGGIVAPTEIDICAGETGADVARVEFQRLVKALYRAVYIAVQR